MVNGLVVAAFAFVDFKEHGVLKELPNVPVVAFLLHG
jgi:hypothetical protein